MSFSLKEPGLVDVHYGSDDDIDPSHQPALVGLIETELEKGRLGVLFRVETSAVSRAVSEFWFGVVQRLAPRGLCAMAIVSPNIAVRAAASGFRVMNSLRGVPVEVKAFKGGDEAGAAAWVKAAVGALKA